MKQVDYVIHRPLTEAKGSGKQLDKVVQNIVNDLPKNPSWDDIDWAYGKAKSFEKTKSSWSGGSGLGITANYFHRVAKKLNLPFIFTDGEGGRPGRVKADGTGTGTFLDPFDSSKDEAEEMNKRGILSPTARIFYDLDPPSAAKPDEPEPEEEKPKEKEKEGPRTQTGAGPLRFKKDDKQLDIDNLDDYIAGGGSLKPGEISNLKKPDRPVPPAGELPSVNKDDKEQATQASGGSEAPTLANKKDEHPCPDAYFFYNNTGDGYAVDFYLNDKARPVRVTDPSIQQGAVQNGIGALNKALKAGEIDCQKLAAGDGEGSGVEAILGGVPGVFMAGSILRKPKVPKLPEKVPTINRPVPGKIKLDPNSKLTVPDLKKPTAPNTKVKIPGLEKPPTAKPILPQSPEVVRKPADKISTAGMPDGNPKKRPVDKLRYNLPQYKQEVKPRINVQKPNSGTRLDYTKVDPKPEKPALPPKLQEPVQTLKRPVPDPNASKPKITQGEIKFKGAKKPEVVAPDKLPELPKLKLKPGVEKPIDWNIQVKYPEKILQQIELPDAPPVETNKLKSRFKDLSKRFADLFAKYKAQDPWPEILRKLREKPAGKTLYSVLEPIEALGQRRLKVQQLDLPEIKKLSDYLVLHADNQNLLDRLNKDLRNFEIDLDKGEFKINDEVWKLEKTISASDMKNSNLSIQRRNVPSSADELYKLIKNTPANKVPVQWFDVPGAQSKLFANYKISKNSILRSLLDNPKLPDPPTPKSFVDLVANKAKVNGWSIEEQKKLADQLSKAFNGQNGTLDLDKLNLNLAKKIPAFDTPSNAGEQLMKDQLAYEKKVDEFLEKHKNSKPTDPIFNKEAQQLKAQEVEFNKKLKAITTDPANPLPDTALDELRTKQLELNKKLAAINTPAFEISNNAGEQTVKDKLADLRIKSEAAAKALQASELADQQFVQDYQDAVTAEKVRAQQELKRIEDIQNSGEAGREAAAEERRAKAYQAEIDKLEADRQAASKRGWEAIQSQEAARGEQLVDDDTRKVIAQDAGIDDWKYDPLKATKQVNTAADLQADAAKQASRISADTQKINQRPVDEPNPNQAEVDKINQAIADIEGPDGTRATDQVNRAADRQANIPRVSGAPSPTGSGANMNPSTSTQQVVPSSSMSNQGPSAMAGTTQDAIKKANDAVEIARAAAGMDAAPGEIDTDDITTKDGKQAEMPSTAKADMDPGASTAPGSEDDLRKLDTDTFLKNKDEIVAANEKAINDSNMLYQGATPDTKKFNSYDDFMAHLQKENPSLYKKLQQNGIDTTEKLAAYKESATTFISDKRILEDLTKKLNQTLQVPNNANSEVGRLQHEELKKGVQKAGGSEAFIKKMLAGIKQGALKTRATSQAAKLFIKKIAKIGVGAATGGFGVAMVLLDATDPWILYDLGIMTGLVDDPDDRLKDAREEDKQRVEDILANDEMSIEEKKAEIRRIFWYSETWYEHTINFLMTSFTQAGRSGALEQWDPGQLMGGEPPQPITVGGKQIDYNNFDKIRVRGVSSDVYGRTPAPTQNDIEDLYDHYRQMIDNLRASKFIDFSSMGHWLYYRDTGGFVIKLELGQLDKLGDQLQVYDWISPVNLQKTQSHNFLRDEDQTNIRLDYEKFLSGDIPEFVLKAYKGDTGALKRDQQALKSLTASGYSKGQREQLQRKIKRTLKTIKDDINVKDFFDNRADALFTHSMDQLDLQKLELPKMESQKQVLLKDYNRLLEQLYVLKAAKYNK